MAKLRQLRELREEMSTGDLVRIVCVGTPEKVGYFQTFMARSDIAIFSRSQEQQVRNGEPFYVDISNGIIGDTEGHYQFDPNIDYKTLDLTQPRATSYEVLRRKKDN